ncbi:uncharacterized protein PFL1_04000 [Pseudozyma flocculosa PF-1]|uniref:Related to neutral amino acid permease n=2 Tax=Pseudozyma flocculosa TaxID=84751 RepID=A0A5C3EWN1_9BASI|nr:uncharacterized protein PFL1_04000 [Pseudozyma flocculosa PF-1]EPQ28697.1 hypothetical protein PFL1_04000 [Pseudozyma flocculosa PF-1]SPO36653.1 related to neutral amino acid permease [Pseudozyma flocculosa]
MDRPRTSSQSDVKGDDAAEKPRPDADVAVLELAPAVPTAEAKPKIEEQLVEVFSNVEDGGHGPNFRGVSWQAAAVLVAKYQFGIGVLAIPQTLSVLGFVPGLVSLVGMILVTGYAGLQAGYLRNTHRGIFSIGDVGQLLFGAAGREFIGWAYWVFIALCTGATFVTFSSAMYTLSDNAVCSLVWAVVAAVIVVSVQTATRTMKHMGIAGYIGLTSVFVAVWTVVIAVCAQARPAGAPAGIDDWGIRAVQRPTFTAAMTAVCTQLLSLCGTATFFSISAEMQHPHLFTRSVVVGHGFVGTMYLVIGCIIYGRIGDYVASPALASAGVRIAKVAYGLALPGILITALIYGHVGAKYTFVRLLRNTPHLERSTRVHWLTWFASLALLAVFGFVIAASVPFFGDLMGLIGAVCGSVFSVMVPALTSIYQRAAAVVVEEEEEERDADDDGGEFATARRRAKHWFRRGAPGASARASTPLGFARASADYLILVLGAFLLVAGSYSAVRSIIDSYSTGAVSRPFACRA